MRLEKLVRSRLQTRMVLGKFVHLTNLGKWKAEERPLLRGIDGLRHDVRTAELTEFLQIGMPSPAVL